MRSSSVDRKDCLPEAHKKDLGPGRDVQEKENPEFKMGNDGHQCDSEYNGVFRDWILF